MGSNTNEILTRAGIMPDEKELPYTISTSDVEKYLQKKVNTLVERMNRDKGSNLNKIDVNVYTTEAGRNFLPFIIVLPLDVLDRKEKNKRNNTPSIFNTKDSDGTSRMLPEFFKLFSSYTYNKDDETAFFSEDWRRARGVSRQTSPILKSMRTPKISNLENGKLKTVCFMLDPLRVFHDMLTRTDDNRSFKIEVDKWKKVQTGEYKYFLKRVVGNHKGKGYKNVLADELNRKMRGTR